jgi:hypothetical protein
VNRTGEKCCIASPAGEQSPEKSQGPTPGYPQARSLTVNGKSGTLPKEAFMSYEVTLKANVVEVIAGPDAYMQEGRLTTFFEGRDGRTVLDA